MTKRSACPVFVWQEQFLHFAQDNNLGSIWSNQGFHLAAHLKLRGNVWSTCTYLEVTFKSTDDMPLTTSITIPDLSGSVNFSATSGFGAFLATIAYSDSVGMT